MPHCYLLYFPFSLVFLHQITNFRQKNSAICVTWPQDPNKWCLTIFTWKTFISDTLTDPVPLIPKYRATLTYCGRLEGEENWGYRMTRRVTSHEYALMCLWSVWRESKFYLNLLWAVGNEVQIRNVKGTSNKSSRIENRLSKIWGFPLASPLTS